MHNFYFLNKLRHKKGAKDSSQRYGDKTKPMQNESIYLAKYLKFLFVSFYFKLYQYCLVTLSGLHTLTIQKPKQRIPWFVYIYMIFLDIDFLRNLSVEKFYILLGVNMDLVHTSKCCEIDDDNRKCKILQNSKSKLSICSISTSPHKK